MVTWKVLSSNSLLQYFSSVHQPNQNSKLTISEVHSRMKPKPKNSTLFFIKKVSKQIIFWKPSYSRKKNYDSYGAITISNYAVVWSESLAIGEPKVSVSI